MAAINSVQSSLHPHSLSGLSPPRVLMCSASVGSEGSVTLQLRDSTHSTDSTQSAASATLDNALTIGYPDPEMLADVLGNLQTACNSLKTSNNSCSSSTTSIGHNSNSNSNVNTCNSITVSKKLIVPDTTQQPAETVNTSTSTTNRSNSKTCNTSSCLINRSSSTNIQLANVQAMNCSSAASLLSNSNNNPNSNSNSSSNSNSNSSSSSGISNFSSNNSYDSLHIAHKNSNSSSSISTDTSTGASNNHKNVPGPNPPNILKKSRPKLSSPTRHGPQQCQVCSKVFGNASALAKHKLTHSDERKYVCAMCSKAFKRQDHLNGHMMTHRNKKPYECKADGCGKSYCDARSLRRHTENHHAAAATASVAVAVAATPQNQTLSATTGTSLGLSLSPATASGDASSPDGATCIRTYITAAGSVVDAQTGVPLSDEQLKSITFNGGVTVLSPASSNSLSPSVSAASPISITEANLESEGLTRQQLDLISQIMQQTKQSSAQVTVSTSTNMNSYKIDAATTTSTATAQSTTVQQLQSSNSVNRPRTWNMQTQLNSSQKVSITVDNITTATASMSAVDDRDFGLNQQLVAGISPQLLNIVKVDQKPVECNLCHRKFKNIPALNGHMRLHGGYFKKDPEAKKNEKKDTSGPPLQTASIGVRALIEEKIISKRRKDLNKSGAFAVPAPPSNVASNSIKRSASDLDNFLSPKTQSNAAGGSLAAGQQLALPAVTTIKNSSLSIQEIGLPQSIDLGNTSQQKPTNVSVGVGTSCNATTPPNPSTASSAMMHTTTTKCTSTDPKDSTLIELLKRGTRVAVATKRTQYSTNNLITTTDTSAAPHQIITNTGAVVIPSELQVLSTNAANHSTTRLHGSHTAAPVSISLAETTPLSLTISQTTGSSGDIYTLTYSTDSSGIFDEAEVYNVSDAEMLLQTVDSIQLLNDSSDERQSGHSEQFAPANTAINPVGGAGANSVASLADSLLDYQTFHSKELIMANSTNTSENAAHTQQLQSVRSNSLPQSSMPADTLLKQQAIAAGAILSPLHSPLAYPTPPASHENATQSSPFVDEAQHFVESANAFFNEKCSTDFLKDTADGDFFKNAPETTDRFAENDKMLKLKNALEDSDFDTAIKVEDLLSGSDDTECDLREFAEQNLSFLDDDQEFLDDSGNATSPLSESFFTSGIGTAEEVKEALREVLPDEHMKGEAQSENVIDLYYLPGIGLQSQMMPNSEDPLLSSSPRDFGQQRAQQHLLQVQQQQLQQQQQLYTTHLQQKPQMHPKTLQTDLKSAQMHPTSTSFIQGSNNEFPILMTTIATKRSPQIEYNDPGLSQSQHFTNSPSSTQYKNSDTDMQTVIYTGSTDKEEITINPQQSNLEIEPESTAQSVDDTSVYFNNNSTSLLTSHQLTHIAPTRVPTSVPVPFSVSNGSESVLLITPVSQPGSILKRRLRSNDSGDASKYHGLYRSKLRRPTRTHYTPAPTLNPDRKGLGLYCNIRQSFLPGSISFDAIDNDFDDPVGLVDFSDDSKVNLGSAYQAQLPPYEIPGNPDGLLSTASDELLWDPNVVPCVDSLKRFIELSKSGGPLGYHSEEEALQAILQSQGNLQAAIVMLMNTQSTAFQMKWTANELEHFLQSLERHGKNFATIAKELNTKSTGECVQMYYFWKKLNVDYKITHLKVEKPVLPLVQPAELRPHVCEMPDCSASFTSKAALHGHTRIHCYGRNSNMPATSSISTASSGTSAAQSSGTSQLTGQPSSKDDFPCKVCGKVFNKVKSRSAHMKTHRIQEGDVGAAVQQLQTQTQPQLQHQQQLQLQLQQPEAP